MQLQCVLTWSFCNFPVAKYSDFGCAKYSPETEAAGNIAKDSVRVIPTLSAFRRRHIISFSVWSGWLGYPGAGRIPYLNSFW